MLSLFSWRRSGFALLAVGVALGATLMLRFVAPERTFSLVFFFAAVTLSAGVGGFWSGVLATLLSALLCDYFFLTPYHSLSVASKDLPLLVLFLLVALLINGLSERLRAATRAADRRFHDLVQSLEAIVWEGNPRSLQFTFVSRRAESLLGYPVQEWLGESDFRRRILHPDDYAGVMAFYRKALEEAGDHSLDYRVRTADGSDLWLRETIHLIRDEGGPPIRMTGLCVDITERKRAAEQLAVMKDELAALNGITSAVSASLELPSLLTTLKRQLAEHLDIPAGCLFLMDEVDAQLCLKDSWGLTPAALERIRVEERGSYAGENEEAALRTEEARDLPTLREPPGLEVEWDRAEWPHSLALPLLAQGELQGAICLFSALSPEAGPHQEAFFTALGGQVGVLVQNARLFEQVRTGHENLHQLSRQLVNVQEAERRAIARELHDEIGQVLTGLKLSLETALRLPPEAAGGNLRGAITLVNELMAHVGDLSLDLRPAMLDDFGLLPTLLWHFQRYTTLTGVQVRFGHTGLERRFPPEMETTAYRIVQEALTNVARHAQVAEVAVRLWATHGLLGIQVLDQGQGFDPAQMLNRGGSGGLAGMRERALLLDGRLTVETAPGNGVCLTAEFPWSDPEAETARRPQ